MTIAVLPARLLGSKSVSQSTGLFAKEGDMVTIFCWDNDRLLVSLKDADVTQCEGGCVDLRGACDAISRSRGDTDMSMQVADRRRYFSVPSRDVDPKA